MRSKLWLWATLALSVALVAAILLLPPWSPVSITSEPEAEPQFGALTQQPSNQERGLGALPTTTIAAAPEGPGDNPGLAAIEATPAASTGQGVKEGQSHTPAPVQVASPGTPPAVSPTKKSQDVGELIKATEDPDWSVRWDAVNALADLKDSRAVAALVERALRDDNSHPRWRSIWALYSIDREGPEAVPLLISALQDPDPVVVRNAAVALAFFSRPEARPELLRGLKDPDNFRKWEAVFSLGEVGSPEAVAALKPMLDGANEPAEDVRAEVVLTLGRIGGQEMIPHLLNTLRTDRAKAIRMRVALALSGLADASVVGELEQALSTETNPLAREFLENAIAGLSKQK